MPVGAQKLGKEKLGFSLPAWHFSGINTIILVTGKMTGILPGSQIFGSHVEVKNKEPGSIFWPYTRENGAQKAYRILSPIFLGYRIFAGHFTCLPKNWRPKKAFIKKRTRKRGTCVECKNKKHTGKSEKRPPDFFQCLVYGIQIFRQANSQIFSNKTWLFLSISPSQKEMRYVTAFCFIHKNPYFFPVVLNRTQKSFEAFSRGFWGLLFILT